MQRAGGGIGYQNLFVDIVLLATSKHLVYVAIEVDLKNIKHDPITNVTKFVVEGSDVEKSTGSFICKDYDLIWGNMYRRHQNRA